MFSLTRFALNLSALGPQALYACNKAKHTFKVNGNAQCVLCGALEDIEIHHIICVHIFPALACDPNNFIALCDPHNDGCHRKIGHLGCFTSFNPFIQEYVLQAREFYLKYDLRIEFDKPFIIKPVDPDVLRRVWPERKK